MKTRGKTLQLANDGRPLTARAVAELCGVELKTVHNWVAEGRLPHFRTPGRHLRFFPEAVRTFLRECGLDAAPERKRSVVYVEGPRQGRIRSALSQMDCVRTPDVEGALIECGRRSPDLLIVDGAKLDPRALLRPLSALRRHLPELRVFVFAASEHPKTSALEGVFWGGTRELKKMLSG